MIRLRSAAAKPVPGRWLVHRRPRPTTVLTEGSDQAPIEVPHNRAGTFGGW
jgi:hypothetical protein